MARRPKAGGLLYDPGDTLEALESTRFAIYSAWSSISVLRVALCRPGSPETKENIRKQLADQSAELQLLYAKERAELEEGPSILDLICEFGAALGGRLSDMMQAVLLWLICLMMQVGLGGGVAPPCVHDRNHASHAVNIGRRSASEFPTIPSELPRKLRDVNAGSRGWRSMSESIGWADGDQPRQ